MFMQFGNTLLQDKIMIGFSKDSFGLTIPHSVSIYEKLPLKDKVIEKWLYGNAKEFLRCGAPRPAGPGAGPRAGSGMRPDEVVRDGAPWSAIVKRGQVLRIIDIEGQPSNQILNGRGELPGLPREFPHRTVPPRTRPARHRAQHQLVHARAGRAGCRRGSRLGPL